MLIHLSTQPTIKPVIIHDKNKSWVIIELTAACAAIALANKLDVKLPDALFYAHRWLSMMADKHSLEIILI